MDINEYISIDEHTCFGKPRIKGTRIKVSFVLELFAAEMTVDQILEEYPHLTREQLIACLDYAGQVVDNLKKI